MNDAKDVCPALQVDVWKSTTASVVSTIMTVIVCLYKDNVDNRKLRLYEAELQLLLREYVERVVTDMESTCCCKHKEKADVSTKSFRPDDPCECDSAKKTKSSGSKSNSRNKSTLEPIASEDECDCNDVLQAMKENSAKSGEGRNAASKSLEKRDNSMKSVENPRKSMGKRDNSSELIENERSNSSSGRKSSGDKRSIASETDEDFADLVNSECVCDETEDQIREGDTRRTSRLSFGEPSSPSRDPSLRKVQIGVGPEKVLIVTAGGNEAVTPNSLSAMDNTKAVLTVTIMNQERVEELLADDSDEFQDAQREKFSKNANATDYGNARDSSRSAEAKEPTLIKCYCDEPVNFIPNFDLSTKKVQTDVSYVQETSLCGCRTPVEKSGCFEKYQQEQRNADKHHDAQDTNRCGCRTPEDKSRYMDKYQKDEERSSNYYRSLLPDVSRQPKVQVNISNGMQFAQNGIDIKAGTAAVLQEDEYEEDFGEDTQCICSDDDYMADDDYSDGSDEDEPRPQLKYNKMSDSFDKIAGQIRKLSSYIMNPEQNPLDPPNADCDCKTTPNNAEVALRGTASSVGYSRGNNARNAASKGGSLRRKISNRDYCEWKKKWNDRLAQAETGLDRLRTQLSNFSIALKNSVTDELETARKVSRTGCSNQCPTISEIFTPKVQSLICTEIKQSDLYDVDIPPKKSHHCCSEPVSKNLPSKRKSLEIMPHEALSMSAAELEELENANSRKSNCHCNSESTSKSKR